MVGKKAFALLKFLGAVVFKILLLVYINGNAVGFPRHFNNIVVFILGYFMVLYVVSYFQSPFI